MRLILDRPLPTPSECTAFMSKRQTMLLAAVFGWLSAASAMAQSALPEGQNSSTSAPPPFSGPRELLESLGVDQTHFDSLANGRNLDGNEQVALLKLLFAVRRFGIAEVERWADRTSTLNEVFARPDDFRGEILHLSGMVTRVAIEKPSPETAARYEMPQYYCCDVLLGEARLPATIYAHAVPSAWKIGAEMTERIGCWGFFVKLAGTGDSPRLVFAAQRVAWYPDDPLGDLNMDRGLFDMVKHRTSILTQERECFYQMLAAVGRADPQEVIRLTQRDPQDDYSVVPLFNAPEEQIGKLMAFTGTARRALLVRLDPKSDADMISRLGFDHYYQVEIFTADSQGNPLVFCLRELPTNFPTGPDIHETVRIPGFFYKVWAYEVQTADGSRAKGRQLAPMLIAQQAIWLPAAQNSGMSGAIAAALFLVALAGLFIGVWYLNRGDRLFRKNTLARHLAPEQGVSQNDLVVPDDNKPDFSGLE